MTTNESKKRISGAVFIKSILKFSVSSWVNFFISIGSVTILTRIFPPEIYGDLSIFNATSNLFMGFVCLGLDSGFMRFYNEPPRGLEVKQLLAKCMGVPIILLLFITLLIVPFFYKEIASLLFNRISCLIVELLCINTFSLVVLNYFSICYRISNNAKKYTIQSILVQFFAKCFVIMAAVFNPTFDTIIIFNTMGIFALSIMYFFIQKKDILPKKINWSMKEFLEVLKYAIYVWPITILIYFNSFFPQFIISRNLGSYELGIYVSAAFFVGALGVIQNGFRTYWATFMFANYKNEQDKIIKVHDYVVLFAIFIMGLFIIFQHIFYQLLGSNYQASRCFFTLILIYPLFNLISETTSYGIAIAKKTRYNLIINILSTIVNFVMAYVVVNYYGLIGVAFAAMIAAVVQLGISSIVGQQYYKSIDNPNKTIISVILIIFLACSNYIFIDYYLIEVLITVISYAITMVIYKNKIIKIFKAGILAVNLYFEHK